jgi:hypothetical protein
MTTGSTVLGVVDGLDRGPSYCESGVMAMIQVNGNPDSIVTVQVGSDIAVDVMGGSLFMGLSAGAENWIALGSVAA